MTSIGKLYVVATPIGNLEDISFRAKTILSQVQWVAAEDTRHSQQLLGHLQVRTPLISYHEHNETARVDQLIEKLLAGESGALISDAGTPLISDPGYVIVARCHEAHIPVIAIPGPCALIAGLSVSGLPTDKFLFEGFMPAKSTARIKRFEALRDFAHTIVFYESPHRIQDFMQDAVAVFGGDRLATIAREITKRFETTTRATLQTLLDEIKAQRIPDKGEFIVAINGATLEKVDDDEAQITEMLKVLMAEVSVKQAVQIAVKLSHKPKNWVYDLAMRLK